MLPTMQAIHAANLSLSHALRIKSAELWMQLGHPREALAELERLPAGRQAHPRALKVRILAIGRLRAENQDS
jgi:hypothetical protein